MSDETTTDMLAEIDRDMVEIETLVADLVRQALQANYPQQIDTTTEMLAETEAQAEYAPPEDWRVLQVGEVLQEEDWIIDARDGNGSPTRKAGSKVGEHQVGEHQLYIRRIEPQSNPKPVQVCEGRWRTRSGEVKNIKPCKNVLRGANYVWPWTDGFMTFQDNGLHQGSKESPNDLVEYLGPIEQQPETQQNGLVRDVTHLLQESGVLDLAKAERQIEELRCEVSYVQRLLGESRQRVTQLEELVGSLRTINEAQEKSVRLAGQENTDLKHRLDVVSAEWAEQSETVRKLQIELDAAQQVPADSPELRQLRADLAEVTRERDEYRYAHDVLVKDANTVHERTKAMTVEAIAEWLEPFRGCNSPALALLLLEALPAIMRSLTGLTPED